MDEGPQARQDRPRELPRPRDVGVDPRVLFPHCDSSLRRWAPPLPAPLGPPPPAPLAPPPGALAPPPPAALALARARSSALRARMAAMRSASAISSFACGRAR